MRSRAFVEEVRAATRHQMKIISKIECVDGLEHLDEIIDASDFLLLDRGDLSKEIPIEKIPLTQKIVLSRARQAGKGVFVATNLLESMVTNQKPTRAEVNDIVNTILDGAYGLTLSAETAIGKHPIACVNMLNRLISEAQQVVPDDFVRPDALPGSLTTSAYVSTTLHHGGLAAPHGGTLVDRVLREQPDAGYIASLPKVLLDAER